MHLMVGCILLMATSFTDGQLPAIYTTTGQRCAIPFIYMRRTYYSCITANNGGVPWCSLTENYDRARTFGTCSGVTMTSTGRQCYIPGWWYKDQYYVGCTTDEVGVPWCGVKEVVLEGIEGTGSWGYCEIPPPPTAAPTPPPPTLPPACDVVTTRGPDFDGAIQGTAFDGSQCVFPFFYQGVSHNNCITDDKQGAWCSITSKYLGRWGYCRYKRATIRTNSGDCVFPFRYRGVYFYYCTSINHNQAWCATTRDYDTDGQWGECQLPTCG